VEFLRHKKSTRQADGKRLQEAKMINLSLTHLGNVIMKLTDGKKWYVPYRDSNTLMVPSCILGLAFRNS
jgi:hypothetical protein